MKIRLFVVLLLLASAAFSQNVEETLQEIKTLQVEIAQSQKLLEKNIAELKSTNPLFADQDPFENNDEYVSRIFKAMPQIDSLRRHHLKGLWMRMGELRSRLFETRNITLRADTKQYDSNNETWPIEVQHNDYQKEKFRITIKIPRDQARLLNENLSKVQVTGILTIDPGDRIGLARVTLNESVSGVYHTSEYSLITSFEQNNGVVPIAFSPDGKLLATGSFRRISVFDVQTGKEKMSFGRKDRVYSLGFSPNGEFLAVGSHYDGATIFNLQTSQTTKSFNDENAVFSVAFSPDGRFLAMASDHGVGRSDLIDILDLKSNKVVESFPHSTDVNSVVFSPNGQLLAMGSFTIAKIYDLQTAQLETSYSYESTEHVYSVAFSPDGQFLCTGSGSYAEEGFAKLFDVKTRKIVKAFKHNREVKSVAFSPDGKLLATGSADNVIRIFNLLKGNIVATFEHPDGVNTVTFSPDGVYLVAGCRKNFNGIANLYRIFRAEMELDDH